MSGSVRAIVFDFDYTLVDSSRGVVRCIDHALRELDLPSVSPESARRTIGLSLPDTLVELAGPEQAEKAQEFVRLFVACSDEIMTGLTVLLGPSRSAILRLSEQGLSLGIVSTKYRYRIEAVLRREALLEQFAVIVGGEDVSAHKPDPEGLLMAMAALGSSPEGTLYVGDSVTDAEAARRAKVPFVAVLSGVTPREALDAYAPYATLDSVAGLPDLLAR